MSFLRRKKDGHLGLKKKKNEAIRLMYSYLA